MIKSNESVKTGINLALGALFELDDAGVAVIDIEVNSARPTITVDRAPPMARPGRAVTETIAGIRSTVYVAELRGCRVQWCSAAPATTSKPGFVTG